MKAISLFLILSFLLVGCLQDDDYETEPLYELECVPKTERITFQEVQSQYHTYEATSTQTAEVVKHEIISQIDQNTTETEFFKFSINIELGCVALHQHSRTIYSNDGQGNTSTDYIEYDISDFYFTEFILQEEGVLASKYFLAGSNQGRKFFAIF